MKNTVFIMLAAILLTSAMGCKKIKGKGDTVTENRTASNYSSIELTFSATVNFRPDSVYRLSVSAQENLMSYIETYVEDGQLVIKIRDHYTLGSHDPITINISAPNVSDLAVSGSGDIYVNGPWGPGNASFYISGSGNISVDTVFTNNLKATISGSGGISVAKGIATKGNLVISGSGTISVQGVKTIEVNATISGSGDIYCWAEQRLVANISGSGNVYYKGSPQIDTNVSGSGTVRPL